jgi:hypothetical protein
VIPTEPDFPQLEDDKGKRYPLARPAEDSKAVTSPLRPTEPRTSTEKPSDTFVLSEISRTSLEIVIASPYYDAVHKQLAQKLLKYIEKPR